MHVSKMSRAPKTEGVERVERLIARMAASARLGLIGVLALTLSTGCAAISAETKERIDSPVSCATANSDIAYFEDERAGGLFRTVSVITGLFPLSAIVLIVRGLFDAPDGAWPDKFRVGFGVYNDKMDAKIGTTREQCGVEAPAPSA